MHARIEPLSGKYYGTDVEISDPGFAENGYIRIWVMGDYEPSERELEGYEKRDGKWQYYDEELSEWFEYEISDTHYETETGYKIAQLLVDAINRDAGSMESL